MHEGIKFNTSTRQKNDYYATHPSAFDILIKNHLLSDNIWEPACGGKFLSNRMKEYGYNVRESDIIDYGGNEVLDFLSSNETFKGDIVTNPPYKHALEFVQKSLDTVEEGYDVCMFLKIHFLESKKRYKFLKETPPAKILTCSNRVICAKNGEFDKVSGSMTFYAWFIWTKGFKYKTTLEVVNGDD